MVEEYGNINKLTSPLGYNCKRPIEMKKRNKVYIDLLRIIAIFLVVVNHTDSYCFPDCRGWFDLPYWAQVLWNEVVKMAVPLFFMVSGALLLPREETLSALFRKRVLRFACVYALIVLVQYIYFCIENGYDLSVNVYISFLYDGVGLNSFFAIWFLCAYIGILVMLPILRIMARGMNFVHYVYLIVIQVLCCALVPGLLLATGRYNGYSFVNNWLPFQSASATLPFSYGYCVFYMLLGYFAEQYSNVIKERIGLSRLTWVAILLLVLGALCMVAVAVIGGEPEVPQSVVFLSAFLPIPCIAVYSQAKHLFENQPDECRCYRWISLLGAATFTVMLTENLFRINFDSWMDCLLAPVVGSWFAQFVLAILVTLSALALGLILKHIPGIRKLL